MKLNDDGDHVTLLSGREFYAHRGIIGIPVDGGKDLLFEGYDGDLDLEGEGFTKAERAEIAAFMVELWKRWAT